VKPGTGSPHDYETSLGLHAAKATTGKQKAFLGSEKQNPPGDGALLVCLDFADIVIDGMTE
jgi:hypothetical protein